MRALCSGTCLVLQVSEILLIGSCPRASQALGDLPLADRRVFKHCQLCYGPGFLDDRPDCGPFIGFYG
jgi:hypothetical protein